MAMFHEIHDSLPEPPELVEAFLKATMAQLLSVWARIRSSDASRALTDSEYGMNAMFREMGDSLPRGQPVDAKRYMDALLAHMVHAYYGAKSAAMQVPELLLPTPEAAIDDDVSLSDMFREVSDRFSCSEREAERYMVHRLQQATEEAKVATQ